MILEAPGSTSAADAGADAGRGAAGVLPARRGGPRGRRAPAGHPRGADLAAPARFWGLSFVVEDLDATARYLGPLLREPAPAVHPGAAHRHAETRRGVAVPVAFITVAHSEPLGVGWGVRRSPPPPPPRGAPPNLPSLSPPAPPPPAPLSPSLPRATHIPPPPFAPDPPPRSPRRTPPH